MKYRLEKRPRVTLRQIRKTLNASIQTYMLSFGEKDGVIRDPRAIVAITCYRKALMYLSGKK